MNRFAIELLDPLERFEAIRGLEDAISERRKGQETKFPHHRFVLDEQERLRPSAHRGSSMAVGSRNELRALGGARQINFESRAVSQFAIYGDVSAALLDDAMAGCEAQAGAGRGG